MNWRTRHLRLLLIALVLLAGLPMTFAASAAPPGVPVATAGAAIGWGDGGDGQFGTNDFNYEKYPFGIADLVDITAVGAGDDHAVFLRAGGTVATLGRNGNGELGNGIGGNNNSNNNFDVPQTVVNVGGGGVLGNVAAIGVGDNHTLALLTGGTVVAWGDNNYGELGNNTGNDSASPVVVRNTTDTGQLLGITAVAAGCEYSLALAADKTVYSWGSNEQGQLGRGNISGSSLPGLVLLQTEDVNNNYSYSPLTNIVAIAAGCQHSLALATDGTVYAWGRNYEGQLGQGNQEQQYNYPQIVRAPLGGAGTGLGTFLAADKVVMLAGGGEFSAALTSSGTVFTWGANYSGQIGDVGTTNTNNPRTTPFQVVGPGGTGTLGGIATIAAGYEHMLALTTGGALYAWGDNNSGQLGLGNFNAQRNVPVQVLRPNGTPLLGVLAIGAGPDAYTSLATTAAATARSAAASANTATFGAQQVGTQSPTQTVTFTNTGLAPLTITGVAITGDFVKVIDLCTGTLAVGASCPVVVAFLPTVVGARTGTLTLSGALITPVAVALSGTGASSTSQFTVTASATTGGTVSDAGAKTFQASAPATYTATAGAGQLFIGWTVSGTYVSYANPLTFTVDGDKTLVARFAARPAFTDVPTSDPDYQAITFLAALGIVNPAGVNGSGQFQPNGDVKRAEVAAFVARAFGWNAEFHANTFPDKCDALDANCVDDELWNNVAALADYGVVGGYTDPATCESVGTTSPCYLPRDTVKRVQVVSVVARAFIQNPGLRPTGFWTRVNATAGQYANVAGVGTQRSDLATYRANVGPIPGQTSDSAFGDPEGNGSRRYVLQVLYAAFVDQFGTDNVP